MSKQSGIYTITNNVNGKIYVGQSSWLKKRIDAHKLQLEKGTHDNVHLQSAYNKYGKDAFSFEIVELCPEDALDERERYYIQKFDSFARGYNRTIGGDGTRGYKASEDSRRKMSLSHKDVSGRNNPMFGKSWKDYCTEEEIMAHNENIRSKLLLANKRKSVVCINTATEYKDVSSAAENLRLTNSIVARCCRGEVENCRTTIDGRPVVCVYKDEYDAMSESDIERRLSTQIYDATGNHNPNAKKIVNITTGEVFDTVNDGARKYNIVPSCISSVISGRTKSAGKTHDGIRCVWVEFDSYVNMTQAQIDRMVSDAVSANHGLSKPNAKAVVCVTTGETFSTATSAGKAYHVDTSSIVACCKGKHSYCGKLNGVPLVWEYMK